MVQHSAAVGADLHSGADFAKLRRLLEDRRLEPGPGQAERRRQPTDAAPGNQHPALEIWPFRHSSPTIGKGSDIHGAQRR